MERRSFLKMIGRTASGGIVVGLYACGTTQYNGSVDCTANPSDPSCQGGNGTGGTGPVFETGAPSAGGAHSHTFEIPVDDLDSPPAMRTYGSSVVGHMHTIQLNSTQLNNIASGSAVGPVTTSEASGHTHDVTFDLPPDLSEDTTTVSSHFHTFTISGAEMLEEGDLTFTSSAVGHTHKITLTQAQRETIVASGSVGPLATTNNSGHTHEVTFQYA